MATLLATNLDKTTMELVISEAVAAATAKHSAESATGKRWINAIWRAAAEIETNPFWNYEKETNRLLVCSSASGKIYGDSSDGDCHCAAMERGQPCKHVAQKRLLQLYANYQMGDTMSKLGQTKLAAAQAQTIAPVVNFNVAKERLKIQSAVILYEMADMPKHLAKAQAELIAFDAEHTSV